MGISLVDVQVNVMESDDDSVDCEDDANLVSNGCIQVVDPFDDKPNFYGHREQLLMGSLWNSSIRKEGQRFESGPIAFCNALCKYSIEVNF